jgi:hypothetical protein
MKLSLEDQALKKTFLEGNFAVDCLEITLTQNGIDTPRTYRVAGCLFISPANGVEARLVWPRDDEHPFDTFGALNAAQRIQSGDLFPDDCYFSLRAVDTAGRIWTHPAILLSRDERQQAEILKIACDFISVESDADARRTLAHFVFHEDIGIRMNMALQSDEPLRNGKRLTTRNAAAKGAVDGIDVDYYPVVGAKAGGAHEFSAVVKDGVVAPEHFDERMLEAVQFCVAKMAWPVMREVVRGGKQVVTLSKAQDYNNGLVHSAIPDYAFADFYRLMERYYQYARSEAKETEAPPLSKKVGGLFTLKGVWLDTVALLLGVSVESILNEPVYKRLATPDEAGKAKIKELIDHVKSSPVDPSLKERAAGIMGGMKSSSASDRLHFLAKAGVVDQDDIKAWKAIRNTSAHGNLVIDPSKLQGLLGQVNRVMTMVYKLVFFRIGYSGAYTDFGKRGWPTLQFDAQACQAALDRHSSSPSATAVAPKASDAA